MRAATPFRRCCVCGKSERASNMFDASPWRAIALGQKLTLKNPSEAQIHQKCREKIKALIAHRSALQNVEVQKRRADDAWHGN